MKRVLLLVIGILWVTEAQAQVVMTCGSSEGHGYFVAGGAVPQAEAGWHSDNISGGKIVLLKQGAEFDIEIRDAQGSFSSRSSGAMVVALADTPAVVVVLVVHPAGATEVYQFRRGPSNRKVVWTHMKYAGLVDKVSAYHAPCD